MVGKFDSTESFIEQYEVEESLWNSASDIYRDRAQKQGSMKRCMDRFGMTESEVKAKINSLRTYYTRELSKERSSANSSVKYESKWPHFKALGFLKESVLSRKSNKIFDDTVEPIYYMTSTDAGRDSEKEGMEFATQGLPTMCTSTDVGLFQRSTFSSSGSKRKYNGGDDDEFSAVGNQNVDGNINSTTSNASKDSPWSRSSSPVVKRVDTVTDDENREPQCPVNAETYTGQIQRSINAPINCYDSYNSRVKNKKRHKNDKQNKEIPPEHNHNSSVEDNLPTHRNGNMNNTFSAKSKEESSCSLFGRHIANGLTNIKCQMSREWAMLKIQEILFEAQFSREFVPQQYTDKDNSSSSKMAESSIDDAT